MTKSERAKDLMMGALVLLAVPAAFFAAMGVLGILRQSSCDRLDAVRISHLEPGHESPGPRAIYVRGVGPGPPPSELSEYLETEAAMLRAGCRVLRPILPPGDR